MNEISKNKDVIDIREFDKFGSLIDLNFGNETYVYSEEQDALVKILDEAISCGYNEDYTIKFILDYLDELPDLKVDILLYNIGEIIKIIFENAKDLTKLQKKRYSKIL